MGTQSGQTGADYSLKGASRGSSLPSRQLRLPQGLPPTFTMCYTALNAMRFALGLEVRPCYEPLPHAHSCEPCKAGRAATYSKQGRGYQSGMACQRISQLLGNPGASLSLTPHQCNPSPACRFDMFVHCESFLRRQPWSQSGLVLRSDAASVRLNAGLPHACTLTSRNVP